MGSMALAIANWYPRHERYNKIQGSMGVMGFQNKDKQWQL